MILLCLFFVLIEIFWGSETLVGLIRAMCFSAYFLYWFVLFWLSLHEASLEVRLPLIEVGIMLVVLFLWLLFSTLSIPLEVGMAPLEVKCCLIGWWDECFNLIFVADGMDMEINKVMAKKVRGAFQNLWCLVSLPSLLSSISSSSPIEVVIFYVEEWDFC